MRDAEVDGCWMVTRPSHSQGQDMTVARVQQQLPLHVDLVSAGVSGAEPADAVRSSYPSSCPSCSAAVEA